MNRKELEIRLIDFAVLIVKVVDVMPKSKCGHHFSSQLLRSGTSPALNYAESQSAESKKDFVHKMSIVLKELRESLVCLIIIQKSGCCTHSLLIQAAEECNELISIFVKSIQTAKKRR